MKFSTYSSHQTELTQERFRALERVVQSGNEAAAEVLVVAGDLFHRVGVAAKIVEQAAAILDRFEGAAVLVLPGNHDYLAPEGDRLWAHFREAAGDRTVLLDTAGPVDLSRYDLPLHVLAAPCDARHGTSHRLGWATDYEREPGMLVLGVAHGSVDGLTLDSEGHYFPMKPRLLGSLPADLWIVGHTHRQHNETTARLVVPGTPEPDGFDCPVAGVAALINLHHDGYELEPVTTGRYRFYERSVTIQDPRGERSRDDLAATLTELLPAGDALVRITVDGTLADESFGTWNALREELLGDGRIVRIDDTALDRVLTASDVDRRYATGSFVHQLLSRLVAADDHDALGEVLSLLEEMDT